MVFLLDPALDNSRLDANHMIQFVEHLPLKNRRLKPMIMIINTTRQDVFLAFLPRELQTKRAISGSLAVLLRAHVGGSSLLAPVAIQNVDTVAVRVQAFRPLRDHLHILRGEECVHVLTDLQHR